jgi:hypothetical protein
MKGQYIISDCLILLSGHSSSATSCAQRAARSVPYIDSNLTKMELRNSAIRLVGAWRVYVCG